MSESPLSFGAEIAEVVEQREAELYWDAHERRNPSRAGGDVPDDKVYDSMDELIADLGAG